MRGKVGGILIVVIIGFIALVFVFEGVFGPRATRGLHEGSVAGKVNGDAITIGDYNKALERKLEFLKGLTGGKVTDEQMRLFRVRESVFQELVQQRLMVQAAQDSGRAPSDEAVRAEIVKLPYFQQDGKFDPARYRAVLEANHYTTPMFERMIREQLAVEEWSKGFAGDVRVSEAEAKEEYLNAKNVRSYKIVSLPAMAAKVDAATTAAKVDAATTAAKVDGHATTAKVPAPEALTPKMAAEKAAALLRADAKSDAAVNAVLKPFGVTVREVNEATAAGGMAAGLSDHPELAKDLFGEPGLPIGKAKLYESPSRITVLLVTSAKRPDLAKFEAEKGETQAQIRARKERELMNGVMRKLLEKAKIDTNPSVVGETEAETETG